MRENEKRLRSWIEGSQWGLSAATKASLLRDLDGALTAARDAALEEAATLCRETFEIYEHSESERGQVVAETAKQLEEDIRALRSQPAQFDALLESIGVPLNDEPEKPADTRRECTCTGSCRGPEGLGEGWRRALGKEKAPPSAPESERCVCGRPRSEHDKYNGRIYKDIMGSIGRAQRILCQGFTPEKERP